MLRALHKGFSLHSFTTTVAASSTLFKIWTKKCQWTEELDNFIKSAKCIGPQITRRDQTKRDGWTSNSYPCSWVFCLQRLWSRLLDSSYFAYVKEISSPVHANLVAQFTVAAQANHHQSKKMEAVLQRSTFSFNNSFNLIENMKKLS